MTGPAFDAIVLAGGTGRRLGGVSKPELELDGTSLLTRALCAVSDVRAVVVVGPAALSRFGAPTVMEEPAGGGPVAGIGAGLDHLDHLERLERRVAEHQDDGDLPVAVLACDLPLAGGAVPALLDSLAHLADADGVMVVDSAGRDQPLLAVYRREALSAALARLQMSAGVQGASMRELIHELRMRPLAEIGHWACDIDTWEQVALLETHIRSREVRS